MTSQVAVALIAAIGVIGSAAIGAVGVVVGHLWRKLTAVEAEIAAMEEDERRVWWWARRIADMYYRHRKDGAPDLPDPPTRTDDTP